MDYWCPLAQGQPALIVKMKCSDVNQWASILRHTGSDFRNHGNPNSEDNSTGPAVFCLFN